MSKALFVLNHDRGEVVAVVVGESPQRMQQSAIDDILFLN